MNPWTVQRRELAKALTRMKKLKDERMGHASWSFGEGFLLIQWGGMQISVEAKGSEPLRLQIDGGMMSRLVLMPFPGRGELVLQVKQGDLDLGGLVLLPCSIMEEEVPQLLPMDASDLDLLLLAESTPLETLLRAGLVEALREVEGKRDASIAKALESLSWLGVSSRHLEAWIKTHLQAQSFGMDSFSLSSSLVPYVIDCSPPKYGKQ